MNKRLFNMQYFHMPKCFTHDLNRVEKRSNRLPKSVLKRLSAYGLAVLLCLVCLTACGQGAGKNEAEKSPHKLTFFAMDTVMSFTAYGDEELFTAEPEGSSVLDEAKDLVIGLDGMLSVTDESSLIYKVNHSCGTAVNIPDDIAAFLTSALEICGKTDGALDLTVYPVVNTWGFTTRNYRVPSAREINDLLTYVDYRKVIIKENSIVVENSKTGTPDQTPGTDCTMIDLGAVAKGYAADVTASLLKDRGVSGAVISLGGNIRTVGSKPDGSRWNVAIASPDNSGYIGTLKTGETSVVTSGGYERYFEENGHHYCHIIDPSTGYPVENGILSVTVIAESGLLCDGLSTALFVMGTEAAEDFWRSGTYDFDFIILTDQDGIYITEGVSSDFTVDSQYEGETVHILHP